MAGKQRLRLYSYHPAIAITPINGQVVEEHGINFGHTLHLHVGRFNRVNGEQDDEPDPEQHHENQEEEEEEFPIRER